MRHSAPEHTPEQPTPGYLRPIRHTWAVIAFLILVLPVALYLGIALGTKGGVVDYIFPNASVRCER